MGDASARAYQWRMNTPANRRRFQEVHDWLISVDVCPYCAVGISLAIVHREATGERIDWKQAETAKKSAVPNTHRLRCEALARERWSEAPTQIAKPHVRRDRP
jgi:hypothetical protein